MNELHYPMVVFIIDEQRYALSCEVIQRIIRAVEITPLVNKQNNMLGIINLQGDIIPIVDIRSLLKLSPADVEVTDLIIIIEHLGERFGFVVNQVNFMEVMERSIVKPKELSMNYPEEIIKDPEGPIHIINVEELMGQSKLFAVG